jgi:FtsP/CotA-like multicopper oxidase with cupredoxin domain
MKTTMNRHATSWALAAGAALLLLAYAGSAGAQARIDGITGVTTFNFQAGEGQVSIADGGSYEFWGYEDTDNNEGVGVPQYPGPTIILNQGDIVTINLTSALHAGCTSMVFPGHSVTASGGSAGLLTQESCGPDPLTDAVTYTFTASEPGTYMYYSGTEPELQIEMGLLGAIIVRPSGQGFDGNSYAYNHDSSYFDHEVMFLLTSMDPSIHQKAEQHLWDQIDMTQRLPVYWFINGRAAPDDLADAFVGWLPHQPYNCTPRMSPGQHLLVRILGGDMDQHPLHLHGNHYYEIARYGRLLLMDDGVTLASQGKFTTRSVPGQTVDAVFTWTGQDLGWDIYGGPADGTPAHACIDGDGDGFGDVSAGSTYEHEYCADHNKNFPVTLPENQNLGFGGWWSGSPFMGTGGALPPGEGGLNPYSGYFFMWHSHTEKELTNYDIFPGGMLSMMVVEPPGTPIPSIP